MAKNLLIMRHAKSSWADGGLTDHQRPLNKRGRRVAPLMAEMLVTAKLVPDLIVLSSSQRTTETAKLMDAMFDSLKVSVPESRSTDDLYHAPMEVYFNIASQLDDDLETVLMLGHNPGIEELVEKVTGKYERMPTAALAVFTSESESWNDACSDSNWQLKHLWRPKEI